MAHESGLQAADPSAVLGHEAPRWTHVVRRFTLPFLLSTLGLVAIAWIMYAQDKRYTETLAGQQSEYIVNLACTLIRNEIVAVRSDLLYLSHQSSLNDMLAGNDVARTNVERDFANFAQEKRIYDQIRYLNHEGEEVVRINYSKGTPTIVPRESLQPKSDRYYYKEALTLETGQIFVSPLDLNVEHGQIERPLKPVIRLLTPISDQAGTKRGSLILNYLAENLLSKIQGLGQSGTGQVLLVNRDSEFLMGISPEDAWGWMLGHDRRFGNRFPTEWERMQKQPEGQFLTSGGLFTFRHLSLRGFTWDGPEGSLTADHLPVEDPSSMIAVSFIPSGSLRAPSDATRNRLAILGACAVLVVAALSWYSARSRVLREDQQRRLADSEGRLRLLSRQLLTLQEEERRRISRELHDGLGQLVTALKLDLGSARRLNDPARLDERLQSATNTIDHLLHALHDIATDLRPSVLDDLGLTDALESHIGDFQSRTGITVEATLDGDERRLSPEIKAALYRITQESLTNIAKHAGVRNAVVELETTADRVHLRISDEGVGFEAKKSYDGRLGLLSIRERAELLMGSVQIQSSPGRGTTVQVTLPLSADDEATPHQGSVDD